MREEMYQEVRRNLSPSAITNSVGIRTSRAKRTGRLELGVYVHYAKGLGPIFEAGTKQRFTQGKGAKRKYPAGINRGQITTANHAMKNARDKALRRGLTLRYL